LKIIRVLLNSLLLSLIIVGSLLLSYLFCLKFLAPEQLSFQTPIAVVLSLALYLLWSWLGQKSALRRVGLQTRKQFLVAYLVSFLWTPFILIPLQFAVRGVVPTPADIGVTWWFQFPVGLTATLLSSIALNVESSPTRKFFRH
jgi:hypothetical protein